MNRNKKIIYIMVVLLAVIAGWLYFENSSGKEVRAMGFPSMFFCCLFHFLEGLCCPYCYNRRLN